MWRQAQFQKVGDKCSNVATLVITLDTAGLGGPLFLCSKESILPSFVFSSFQVFLFNKRKKCIILRKGQAQYRNTEKYVFIVKIDSRTRSFCLCQYVQNGLSYLG